jgi:radical SAM protein with 4Fe4S-binding SPASM domain
MTPSERVDTDWIAPALPDLRLFERDDRWLCLNPDVPSWICTTKAGALLLQLVDGDLSIQGYHDLLTSHGIDFPLSAVRDFFQSAVDARLFGPPFESSVPPWESHKLTGLYLHVTHRCNLQCTYCYRESSPRLPVLHDAGRFCEMLEFIQPFSLPGMQVTFSGGEPLMHPGFRQIAATSARLGYSNLLLTNGTLLTDELADFVRDHFKSVKISLDGPNEEIHAKTRDKGNFANALRGARKLAERGARVLLQVTLTKSSLPFANDVHEEIKDLPDIAVRFTPLLPMGRGTALDGEYITNDDFYELSRSRGIGVPYVSGRCSRACHAGASSLSIADSGDVYPCHLFHRDEFHLGNIFRDRFEDIFFARKAREFARSMDVEENNPVCRECEMRFLCAGGCHANTLHATGSYHGPDTFCSYQKRIILDQLFRQSDPQAAQPAGDRTETQPC